MVTIVKHEWHSVDSQFAFELEIDTLAQIYPEKSEQELQDLLYDIESGTASVEEVIEDAMNSDVEIEWDHQYDDWWTSRKGGYEVTYELGDENSWHTPAEESPDTHKCTKCRWTGNSWETATQYLRADGSVIDNYFESDEDSDHTKDICPMCDSDVISMLDEQVNESESPAIPDDLAQDLLDNDPNAWPFPSSMENVGTPPSDQEFAEQEQALKQAFENDSEKSEESLQTVWPAGTYTIKLRGYTIETAIGKISQSQYDYWSARPLEDLGEALNDNFDYDANNTPDDAKFEYYWNDYCDVKSVYGVEESMCYINISDEHGSEVFDGPITEFIDRVWGYDDLNEEVIESVEELYLEFDASGVGPVVYWKQGGKGGWFEGTVVSQTEFDFKKLKFEVVDVEGENYITDVVYGTEIIENDGGDYDGKWSEYSVENIE